MISSPPPPRAPPKRTYGRRGRVPSRAVAADTSSGSDTDTDDDAPAAGPSRVPSAAKRARVGSPSPAPASPAAPLARSQSASSSSSTAPTPTRPIARTFSHPAVTVHPPSSSVKSVASRARDTDSPTRARSPRLRDLPASTSRPASPRDLSDIFGAVSPSRSGESQESTASSSNGTLARARPRSGLRRMLSKAQSMLLPPAPEPPAPSTPRALRTTQSMPITPTSGKSDRSGASRGEAGDAGSPTPAALVAPVAAESPGSGGRAQRTYGRQRTFLASRPAADDNGDTAASLAASLAEPPRESYEELRKRYEVDNEPGGSGNLLDALLARAPVPISDMRSKGENRRFMDEVTFLLEGISNAPSKGIRRTSSVDVLKNMQDPAWVHKMDICGQTDRVWDVLRSARNADADDEVMEAVCLLFLDMLVHASGGVGSVLLADAGSVVDLLARNIGLRVGPLDAAYAAKVTPVVSNLRSIYRSFAGDDDGEITTRRAAAHILVAVCETAWATLEPLIPGAQLAPRALGALAVEIQPLSARLPLYAKGLDLLPKDAGTADLVFLEQCLRALVAIATDSSSRSELAAETHKDQLAALVDIVDVMAAVALTADEEDESLRRRASTCTVLALQLLRPLVSPLAQRDGFGAESRTVAALGRVLLGREAIVALLQDRSARTEDDDGARDNTHMSPDELASLVLALFGSMDLDDEAVATLLAETAVSDCTKRPCAVSCRCSARPLPLATALTRLYGAYAALTDDALGSFLHGYLAYLLTKLLTVAPAAAGPLILPSLPGDDARAKLDGLHATLGDLVSLSTVVHRKLREPSQMNGSGSLESVPGDDEGLSRALHDLQELRQQPPWP